MISIEKLQLRNCAYVCCTCSSLACMEAQIGAHKRRRRSLLKCSGRPGCSPPIAQPLSTQRRPCPQHFCMSASLAWNGLQREVHAQEEEAAESAAQDAVTAELQRRATAKAAWLSATRRAALDWLRSPVTQAAADSVAEWQKILQVGPSHIMPSVHAICNGCSKHLFTRLFKHSTTHSWTKGGQKASF